ncbi:Saccharopine dehydrogenase (NAD+, L-lysine forming) [Sulfitobacter noctilucicola]|uniref:Saccharopine dehydrogenase [NAD(+), L-lysine-forming] n=1 Tax=Sulfitobacter noctilucicola TaxID=1342301 RepID=A0A7W6M4H0_9RHOB|nr:saccharopine dehydrogenase [Sulfitobacter noctilucicola]KIN63201.1 Saccharopine dehydrogenase (NAD+, L-lysine forming) [Sulfitobacter noctilucicola]MBB4172274.1 saccharopine dehydrogenase (NAD+, L-lysine-forming) [Sulfitobacter noctilucicola]
MTHLWVRAEQRDNETRVGITPQGVASLLEAGFDVTVEQSDSRVIPTQAYAKTGCALAPAGSWPDAPRDAIVFGLKELPEDGSPLAHRHIMFGHAFKGQASGEVLLRRFRAGGGTLLDLEYLTNDAGRRVAAFGYWAGFAGAAVALKCWAAQQKGGLAAEVTPYANADEMRAALTAEVESCGTERPTALIIGALGRVGTGAADLCKALDVPTTGWDMAETASGGPFPAILQHHIFLNCILAGPQTPVFVPKSALTATRTLSVIGDIACDPDSDFNPVPVYDRATTWAEPALRVHNDPPLDVMAIDNLPSMLPLESSEDYATQLLPTLQDLDADRTGVWARAKQTFDAHMAQLN